MRVRWIGAVTMLAAVALLLTPVAHGRARAASPAPAIVVDGHDVGRTFDGVGAVSAGSSRLLYDYPEPERAQLLDYLFRPGYGASLQVLKVEIGSDANSTVTAEPSHERARGVVDCRRGIDWWLMRQAVARNPRIRLYGLMWGAPGWLRGGWWSADHIRYLLSWLGCARRNGLRIAYLGGANEPRGAPAGFYVRLKRALARRYPGVTVVASDEYRRTDRWYQAARMATDRAYDRAVGAVGEHDVCGWGTGYAECATTATARDLRKPLWNSEESSQDVMSNGASLARALNRDYLDGRMTGDLNWSMAAAYGDDTDTGGFGLLAAQWPWSGYYLLGPGIWVDAQTTQFTAPGWRYLDRASGYLPGGGSYVSLRAPSGGAYTVVAESMDAHEPQTVRIRPAGGLSAGPVHVWSTAARSRDPARWFVPRGTLRPGPHGFVVRVPPGQVVTVSTASGQGHGTGRPRAAAPGTAPLPYRQDFDTVPLGRVPAWFENVAGGFETGRCPGRAGRCYRQVVTRRPYLWHGGGKLPATLTGDPDWWGDYAVTARARSARPVELLGRVDKYSSRVLSGDHLRLAPSGAWWLSTETGAGRLITLADGRVRRRAWHTLGLWFRGVRVRASIDGRTVAAVTDPRHRTGQVGLAVGAWARAAFDDLTVRRTAPAPRTLTPVSATASSTRAGLVHARVYGPAEAIDDRAATWWQSARGPTSKSLTVDLGRAHITTGLIYRPPVESIARGAIITAYRVYASLDGRHFRPLAGGTWNPDIGTKITRWRPALARYLRLEATATGDGPAAAADVQAVRG